MKITGLLAALVVAVTLIAGCSSAGDHKALTAPTTESGPLSSTHTPTVPKQLNFTAKTIAGQTFSGATLAGKPAVLWFWAPWCPTCQREAPTIAKAARANPKVTFVGVAAFDEIPAMQVFVNKYDIAFFTNIADVDGRVWQRFGVTAQPAFAFIGADGAVQVVRSSVSESDLTARLTALAAT